MKFFAALMIILLAAGLSPALAQQDEDDQYLIIYSLIQQADGLAAAGQPQRALAQYAEVQNELQKFQKIYPDWNPKIVNFRLKYLAEKIADVTAELPPTNPPPPTVAATNVVPAPPVAPAQPGPATGDFARPASAIAVGQHDACRKAEGGAGRAAGGD